MVVVGLSPEGQVVREIGQRDAETNLGDDPAQAQTSPGLFFGPRDVAVAGDEIYVTDTGNERVQVFGLDGTFRRTWGGFGQGPDHLIEPVGITIGPDGTVYVADSGNSRISLFAPDGTPLEQWPVEAWAGLGYDEATGSRPGYEPYLAFGPDGLLYASSRETNSIEVLGPGGQLVRSIREAGDDALTAPTGLTFTPDDTLLITDVEQSRVFEVEAQPIRQIDPGDEEQGEAPSTPVGAGAGNGQPAEGGPADEGDSVVGATSAPSGAEVAATQPPAAETPTLPPVPPPPAP